MRALLGILVSSSYAFRVEKPPPWSFVLSTIQDWQPLTVAWPYQTDVTSPFQRDICAVQTNGTITCMRNKMFPNKTASPFVSVSGAWATFFAQRADGTLAGWNYNGEGRISNVPTTV